MSTAASVPMKHPIAIFALFLFITGCATLSLTEYQLTERYGQTLVTDRRMNSESDQAFHYNSKVKPILEKRCVVCHGCYDAPCQLKLSSPEGILRGASKDLVYDGTRLLAASPTRIGIDAQSTEEWRAKDFHPILNERSQVASFNQENSALYQLLQLKKDNPLPEDKILSDDFELGLDREQQCPAPAEIEQYKQDHKLWGMPYALPGLADEEFELLQNWITSGATMSQAPQLPKHIQANISKWEALLNQDDLKTQLSSRYIYEHLYLANLYFSDTPIFTQHQDDIAPEYFFKLVRSATPPGLPIKPIASRRPYDDPGVGRVYYRLLLNHGSLVSKTHMPYKLNDQRMAWIKSLFMDKDFTVKSLPGYETDLAANPFKAFKDIPVSSRYRFMLEESKFIIQGFIKGPVCRGQVALNVIDDHFWVAFVDPDRHDDTFFSKFLSEQSDNLRLPGEAESNAGIVANWVKYSVAHNQYLKAKQEAMKKQFSNSDKLNLDLVWDGDKENPNVALTIFRHFDSSTVLEGWVGQTPKTTWLITYPLLERIHYLLVAEFDVYGNIGHQLMTRLYMDFLRMEGEANFLALLPQTERQRLTDYWYRDTPDRVKEHLVNYEENLYGDPAIDYKTDQPKEELLTMMKSHFAKSLSAKYGINHIDSSLKNALIPLNQVTGRPANLMPEQSILWVDTAKGHGQAFTLIRNSGHSNINGLLYEEYNLLPVEDYLTLVPGIVGSYPAAYYRVSEFRLSEFITKVNQLQNESDYENLMDHFGIRRTHKNFWQHSDEVHEWFRQQEAVDYGLLDYNRLENR